MYRIFALLACASFVACTNGPEEEVTPEDTATGDECANAIVSSFPADGETSVYYRTNVEIVFQTGSADFTIDVTSDDGPVAGDLTLVDNTLVFAPAEPLAPSTGYTVTVNYDCGSPELSWTTSEVGGAVDGADIIDAAYALDLGNGRFVQPEGVGPLLQQLITVDILVGVSDVTDDGGDASLEIFGAISEEGSAPPVQDLCQATISDFPAADFNSNPFFAVGPESVAIGVEGFEISIDDMYISGAFSPDGTYIDGARVSGFVDTRPLGSIFEEGGDEDTICNLVATFLIECEPCPADDEPFCLSIEVDSMSADILAESLVVRTEEDVAADESCGGGEEEEEETK